MSTATATARFDNSETPPEQLVARASDGDGFAWEALVDLYSGLVWAVTRQFRLCDADAADVAQTTWLRLLEHIDRLRDASRVGPWLATTARRECLRTLAHRKRVVLTGDEADLERTRGAEPEIDAVLLSAQDCSDVRDAMAQLPPRWRDIMTLLATDPPLSYEAISARLQVPIGSIGPTRRRSLQRLQILLDP